MNIIRYMERKEVKNKAESAWVRKTCQNSKNRMESERNTLLKCDVSALRRR